MTEPGTQATPLSLKEHLWMAALIGVLLIASVAWTWMQVDAADPFLQGDRPGSGAYVRREKKPPLSPARYVGQTARAYQIAHEIPDILDRLYCYCGCDRHLGHKSLLSCFTDDHGAT